MGGPACARRPTGAGHRRLGGARRPTRAPGQFARLDFGRSMRLGNAALARARRPAVESPAHVRGAPPQRTCIERPNANPTVPAQNFAPKRSNRASLTGPRFAGRSCRAADIWGGVARRAAGAGPRTLPSQQPHRDSLKGRLVGRRRQPLKRSDPTKCLMRGSCRGCFETCILVSGRCRGVAKVVKMGYKRAKSRIVELDPTLRLRMCRFAGGFLRKAKAS